VAVRTDDALLRAARDGEDEAFTDLYRRHAGAARRYAVRRCRNASADDAVAVAFASVFRAVLNGGGPSEDFKSYLLVAVRNAITDQVRRRGRVTEVEIESFEEEASGADVIEHPSLGALMGAALGTLPDRQRRALWDTEVEGHTNDEMARRLELSSNAFAALKKRARRNLADAYETQVAGGDVCVWVSDRIDAYLAAGLLRSDQLVIDLHVEHCAECTALLPDRSRTKVGLLALPLLLAAPFGIGRGRTAAAARRVAAGRRLVVGVPRSAAGFIGVAVIAGTALVMTLDDGPAALTPDAAPAPVDPPSEVRHVHAGSANFSVPGTRVLPSSSDSSESSRAGADDAAPGGDDLSGTPVVGVASVTALVDATSLLGTDVIDSVVEAESDGNESHPTSTPASTSVAPSTTSVTPIVPPPPATTVGPPTTLPLTTLVLVPSPTTTMIAPNYALPVTTVVPPVVRAPATTTTASPRIVRAD
jgi:RNA polymerase sigma factor (sigma-70 family)